MASTMLTRQMPSLGKADTRASRRIQPARVMPVVKAWHANPYWSSAYRSCQPNPRFRRYPGGYGGMQHNFGSPLLGMQPRTSWGPAGFLMPFVFQLVMSNVMKQLFVAGKTFDTTHRKHQQRQQQHADNWQSALVVEVDESDTAYTLRAEVPGYAKTDIKVTLDPETYTLTMTGHRQQRQQQSEQQQQASEEAKQASGADWQEPQWRQWEATGRLDMPHDSPHPGSQRSATSFRRSFTVPEDVDLEQAITAKTENGVLTVVLPKRPAPVKPPVKEVVVE